MTRAQWMRVGVLTGLLLLLTATTGLWGLGIVLGIVLMVFLHELGHFLAAKRAGMKVTEFFIGFGPRIWSFQRGETTYGLKVIPAGAYVKLVGMHSLEEVPPADEARTYRQGRFRHRFAVVVAGPLMNLAVGLVLIWIALAVLGAPGGSITGEPDATRWSINTVYPGSGAAEAGLRSGDKIVAIDGNEVREFQDIPPLVSNKVGEVVQVTFERGAEVETVGVTLGAYAADDGTSGCCLGVSRSRTDVERERVGPIAAVPQSFTEMADITRRSLVGLRDFFTPNGLSSFGDQVVNAREDRAQATAPVTQPSEPLTAPVQSDEGITGENRLISLVGFFQIGTTAADSGLYAVTILFVILNISLGIINLVPLLPFDGGHATIAVYEKLQELRRKMSTRYFTDVSRLMPLTYGVVALLGLIFLTTIWLDIVNPLV